MIVSNNFEYNSIILQEADGTNNPRIFFSGCLLKSIRHIFSVKMKKNFDIVK
jgi:hypothetical protein